MKKRIEWLDILKGFLIITVMMGHTEGIPIGLKTWIYSFHMPLFFFLSGFTLSVDKYDFKTFLQKKLKTLLLPGITFMIIIGAYSILVLKVKLTVQNFFLGVIMQMRGQDITIAWFLVCLFLSEITLYIIIKFLKDNNKNVSILLMVISMLNFIYIKFISKSLSNTILPYSIDVIGIVIPFIYLGYLTKKEEYFEFKNYNVLIGISSMVLGVILCTINYKIFRYHVDIYSDMIGSYSLFYGSAILGIIGLITKYGGAASHMAIRCAEFNIPAAIGSGSTLFDYAVNSKIITIDCKHEKIIRENDEVKV